MRRWMLILFVLASTGFTLAQGLEQNFLALSPKDTFALGPKEFCCPGTFSDMTISADGRYVIGHRMTFTEDDFFSLLTGTQPKNQPKIRYTIYDSKSRKAVDLNLPDTLSENVFARYLFDGVFLVSSTEKFIAFVDSQGRIRAAGDLNSAPPGIIVPIPGLKLFAMQSVQRDDVIPAQATKNSQSSPPKPEYFPILIFDVNGKLVQKLDQLPPDSGLSDVSKTSDGILYYSRALGKNFIELNLRTGASTEIAIDSYQSEREWIFYAREGKSKTREGDTVSALFLSAYNNDSEESSAQSKFKRIEPAIALGGSLVMVSDDNSTVYISDTSGLSRISIRRVDAEALARLMKQRIQQEAMVKAKMVGTGMMIYAADYDDYLPLGDGWADALHPYMKNRELTDGFIYLQNGLFTRDLDNPTQVEIGRVETQYGSAVVYADGHVKWQDQNAKPPLIVDLRRRPTNLN